MWYKIQNQQVKIFIFAKPNAKKTAVIGIKNNELHIALHAKPQEGEANQVLVEFLAKLFDIAQSQVILQRGKTSRHKQVIVPLTKGLQRFLEQSF